MAISILLGTVISLMVLLNGKLQALAGPETALVIVHAVGLVMSLTAGRFLSAQPGAPSARAGEIPVWYLAAGVLGVPVLYLNNLVFLRGGVLLVLSGMLGGQSVAALLIEILRPGNSPVRLTGRHLIPIAFILPGCLAVGISASVSLLWILAAWIPGVLLMIQISWNAGVALTRGRRTMLVCHYLSGLLAALSLLLFSGSEGIGWSRLVSLSPALLFGGGMIGVLVVGAQALLLPRIGAVRLVLGIYLGQFLGGICLDILIFGTLDGVYLAGALFILAGIIGGELSERHEKARTVPGGGRMDR